MRRRDSGWHLGACLWDSPAMAALITGCWGGRLQGLLSQAGLPSSYWVHERKLPQLLIFPQYRRPKLWAPDLNVKVFSSLLPSFPIWPIPKLFLIISPQDIHTGSLSAPGWYLMAGSGLLNWRHQGEVQYLGSAVSKEGREDAHHLPSLGRSRCPPEGLLSRKPAVDAHSRCADAVRGPWWHREGQSADLLLKNKPRIKVLLIQKSTNLKLLFKPHSAEASLAEL